MTAPTFVAAGTLGSVNGTSTASGTPPGLPTGLASGDFLLLHVLARGTASTVPTPTGYTAGDTLAFTNGHRGSWFWKIAGGSESAPTVTQTVSALLAVKLYAFRGVDQTNPLDVAAQHDGNTAQTTFAAPSITPVSLNTMAVWLFSNPDDNTLATPSQGTLITEATTLGNDGALSLVYEAQTNATSTGTTSLTQTANGPDNWVTFSFALRAAAVASVDPTVDLFDDITHSLEFAFGQSPFTPSPVWTDLTTRLVNDPLVITRGRSDEFAETQPGTMSFTLRTEDRYLDPDYSSGPYYGQLVPLVQARWRTKRNSVVVGQGRGLVQTWPQTYYGAQYTTVSLQVLDITSVLAQTDLPPTPLALKVMTDKPFAYWPMLETDPGSTMSDLSGGGHDGSYNWYRSIDSATGATPIQSFIPSEPDKYAKLIRDPNSDDLGLVFSAPGGADLYLAFTVEFWLQTSTMTEGDVVILFSSANILYECTIAPAQGGVRGTLLTVHVYDAASTITTLTCPVPITPTHIALTIDSTLTTVNLYRNGALADTADVSAGVFESGTFASSILTAETSGESYCLVAHFATYDSTLTSDQLAEHYEAGRTGGQNEVIGDRMTDLAEFVGLVDAGLYDGSNLGTNTYLAAASFDGDVMAEVRKLIVTEQGRIYVDGDGVLTPEGRVADMKTLAANAVSQATFVEFNLPGDIGYTDFESEPASRDLMRNTVTVTFPGGTATLKDVDLATRYPGAAESLDTSLPSAEAARNLAASRIRRYGEPLTRIRSLTLRPRGNPDELFPIVLNLKPGMRVTTSITPNEVGSAIVQALAIEGFQHEVSDFDWTTTLYLAPPQPTYTEQPWFVVGDATYGRIGTAAGNEIPY